MMVTLNDDFWATSGQSKSKWMALKNVSVTSLKCISDLKNMPLSSQKLNQYMLTLDGFATSVDSLISEYAAWSNWPFWFFGRIFLWKGVPHISAVFRGIGYVVRRDQDRGSYQSIFRMEQTSRTFKLLKIFSNPANGAQGPPEVQKNWGFFEHQKSLLILYSVFPCATIYRVLNDDNFHFELVSKVCYKDRDSMLADNIMLEIERSHNSAHPIVWNHDGRKEILMMVHTHTTHIIGGYNHWLVRFSFDTFEITHVSYGIVFGTAMFHSEGPEALGGKIIIAGTITITSDESGDHLHIFGGEGDSHCIYHTVPLSSIFWLPIGDATSVVSRINIDDVNSGGEVGTHQRKKDGSTQN